MVLVNLSSIKEVVVLKGLADSGKTGILCQLCDDYLKSFGSSKYWDDQNRRSGKDRVARVLLPDGRVLGIGTAGDNADTVLESFMSFHDQGCAKPTFKDCGCDIVVIAVRTSKRGRKVVTTYMPKMSMAEVELDELVKSHGSKWKFILPPGKASLCTTKFPQGIINFSMLCANDAAMILSDIHKIIGY